MKAKTEALLELILSELKNLVDYELAVILKLHDNKTLGVEKAIGPLVNGDIYHYNIDLNKRMDLANIISVNEPHLFGQTENHIDAYDKVVDLPQHHSCLLTPLYIKDSPIGLLTLDHSVCGVFTPQIVNFIGTLSKLIAVLIDQNDSSIYLDSLRKDITRERNILLEKSSTEFENMIGNSPKWEIVKEKVKIVAESELPVLIQGETGTGKEQVARTLHLLSSRKDSPFITLNCSALSSTLAESELFGHEKGAFTSALNKRRGRFEMANGGTLFLDEIGDLPQEIQPKILRTLQEGTYERVGGEETLYSDVRIIAASNKDLKVEVTNGRFREDLYYRLGVFPIFLPSLRERGNDVVLLAEYFLKELRLDLYYKDVSLSYQAMECLVNYAWNGNVRELQNVIKRAALVSRGGEILCEHLSLVSKNNDNTSLNDTNNLKDKDDFLTLSQHEKIHIQDALVISKGKIYGNNGAAQLLGMKPTTLQSRMKKHDL